MLRVSEVAKKLGVSQKTVYRLIDDGKLRAIVVSGKKIRRFRIEEEELQDFIERNRTE